MTTIRIPAVIDPALTGNSRAHPMKKHQLTQELKGTTMLMVRTQGPGVYPFPPWVLNYTVARPKGKQALDDDNIKIGLKPVQDGIAEEIGIDDRYITIGTVTQIKDEAGQGYIDVEIELAADERRTA